MDSSRFFKIRILQMGIMYICRIIHTHRLFTFFDSMYVDICMNHYAYLSYGIRSKGGKNVSNPYVVKKKLQTLETLESLANIISLKQHLVDDIQGYKNDIDTFKHTLYQVGTRKMILRRQYFKLCRKKRRVDKEIVNIQQRMVQTEILLNNAKCKLESFC